MPEKIPQIADRLDQWRTLTFVELCQAIVDLYATDLRKQTLDSLIERAYANFDCEEVVKLVPLGERFMLELFHGPTLAFKDIALQVIGNLFEHVLDERSQSLNILGATSGDTGSAAIAGVRGRENMQIFIMYPKGRISPLQEMQMTSVQDDKVHCLAVDGSFDDCQRIMKEIFNDVEFKTEHRLGAVNSVNWARVMVQIVYYIHSALQFDEPVTFSVPTGNFGNILAGLIAKRMGAPIRNFILATNENDILARFFSSGLYKRGPVHKTTSPSMDIQVASNFERFVFLLLDKDSGGVNRFMEDFSTTGEAELAISEHQDEKIYATRVAEQAVNDVIVKYWTEHEYVLEPHSAIGVAASEFFRLAGPNICLATAHPAKFPEAVKTAVKDADVKHEKLEQLKSLPLRNVSLEPRPELIKDYIKKYALTSS